MLPGQIIFFGKNQGKQLFKKNSSPPAPRKSNGLCLKYQPTKPKLNCKFPAPSNIFCFASRNGGGVNFT
jgi:hypothetical protein